MYDRFIDFLALLYLGYTELFLTRGFTFEPGINQGRRSVWSG